MASNIHVLFAPKMEGNSVHKGYEGQIHVLSWSWGLSQTGTTHHGTGGGSGKVNVQDLSFTHYVDPATPALIQACAKGTHFDKITLTMCKASGDDPIEYLKLELENCIISSVSTGGSAAEDQLTENVTLNFAKFSCTFQDQDSKGKKKGGPKQTMFAIAENT